MSKLNPQPPLEDERSGKQQQVVLDMKQARKDALMPDEPEAVEEPSFLDEEAEGRIDWLQLSYEAYETSTDWLQADLYGQWERNIANFKSIHPSGSKYHTNAYKYRSRMFRPKTRTAIRRIEAGVVSSLFNNKDVVSIEAQDQSNPEQLASAGINKELVQERLTDGSIPWYELVVGGTQDAANYGVVLSHQYWNYETDEQGEVLNDKPVIELIAPENLRVSMAADWTDPINSSPYVIQLIPMYIGDALSKMKRPDEKTGQPAWFELTQEELRSASKEDSDGVRSKRNAPQTDPLGTTRNHADPEFDTVWVHRVFMRKEGKDWMFYTAGTDYLLSEPVEVKDVYPHLKVGERPIIVGTCALEAHRVYPDSLVHLGQNLQSIANDIANRRHDNVLLAMDKRFIIKREANIDRDQLFRTVPGGGIEADDPQTDVKVVETGDVTGSAYAEQDRVNLDFDDLLGQVNQGTKQSGAAANSVGGASLMASDADAMTDYIIRTLLTTWVKPLMSQLIRLEQYYESDNVMLAVAAEKAEIWQRYGVNEITDELLKHNLTTNVNVGIGATNPARKVEMLMSATSTLMNLPGVATRLNVDEVAKEIYGAVGYQDGERFILPDDGPSEQEQQLMAQVEEMQKKLDARYTEGMMRIDMERIRQQGQVEEARVRGEYTLGLESMKQRIGDLEILLKAEANDIKKGELEMERDALVFQMKADQLNIKLDTERESRQDARDFMRQGDTGQRTDAAPRPNDRVADSGAGTIMRDKYGNVPFAEG